MAKPPTELTGIRSIDTLKLDDIVSEVRKERKWSADTAQKAELWYRRFLALSYAEKPRPAFGISKLADHVWHAHITSTARYRRDCQRIFGGYLDHTPGRPAGRGGWPCQRASTRRCLRRLSRTASSAVIDLSCRRARLGLPLTRKQ